MANLVTCRFCGQQISFVRSQTTALTSWTPVPITTSTAPTTATLYAEPKGHSDHARTCSHAHLWRRKAGGAKFIPTDPGAVGLV